MRITPTVGHVVFYRKSTTDTDLASVGNNALAAIIAAVWSDTMVNLHVIDANGVGHSRTSVRLLQEDDEITDHNGAFAYWMPYQKGQAAKNDDDIAKLTARIDALEAALARLSRQELAGSAEIRPLMSDEELRPNAEGAAPSAADQWPDAAAVTKQEADAPPAAAEASSSS